MKIMTCKNTISSNKKCAENIDNEGNPRQSRFSDGSTEAHTHDHTKFDKHSLLMAVLMALVMSSVMSSIIVSFNVFFLLCNKIIECFIRNFLSIWPRSFLFAFVFGVPIILVVSPLVRSIVDKI
jgi:hypothetical protein